MPTVWELVTGSTKLISLPDIYLRLKTILDQPDHTMAEVAEVISQDPAMTTRLLRLVNSSFFGLACRIETVSRAISLLGTRQVHDLVLAASVTQTFGGISNEVMDMDRYWRRSLHCGIVAKELAYKCNVLDSERLFIAGLLRDIGHLIMYQSIPELSQQAITRARETAKPLFVIERDLIGLDHARLGGALMRQWGLPRSLWEATELHVEPARSLQYSLETAIVHIAAHLTEIEDGGDVVEVSMQKVHPLSWQLTGLSVGHCAAILGKVENQVSEIQGLIFPQQKAASV